MWRRRGMAKDAKGMWVFQVASSTESGWSEEEHTEHSNPIDTSETKNRVQALHAGTEFWIPEFCTVACMQICNMWMYNVLYIYSVIHL